MTISKYQKYCKKQTEQLAVNYVRSKYGSVDSIKCSFSVYKIDGIRKEFQSRYIIKFNKDEYIKILALSLQHPEFPIVSLLDYISVPAIYELLYLGSLENTLVVSSTLEKDIKQIAGETQRVFQIPIDNNTHFKEIIVCLWLDKMEIIINSTQRKREVCKIYGDIDANYVKRVLNVSTYRGVESRLKHIREHINNDVINGQLWIVNWLDSSKLSYIYTRYFMKEFSKPLEIKGAPF